MAKIKIFEIATELGRDSKDVLAKFAELGMEIKSASSAVDEEFAGAIYEYITTGQVPELFKKAEKPAKKPSPKKTPAKKAETKKEPKKTEEKAEKPAKKPSPKKTPAKKAAPKATEPAEPAQTEPVEDAQAQPTPAEDPAAPAAEEASKPTPPATPADPAPATPTQTAQPTSPAAEPAPASPAADTPAAEPVASAGLSSGENLANITKRRGLVIVKKKNAPAAARTESSRTQKMSLSMIFSGTDEGAKKKKKDKKPSPAVKKQEGERMDFIGGDFADLKLDNEDELILPDFTVRPVLPEAAPTATRAAANARGAKRPAARTGGGEGGLARRSRRKAPKRVEKREAEVISRVEIPKEIRVYEFAEKLGKNTSELIQKLFLLGKMTTKNDFLDEDELEILAAEFDVELSLSDEAADFDYLKDYEAQHQGEAGEGELGERAPVITIMGHVDHGKTSLLDFIRNSRIAHGEAGGITQHVGAYMVERGGRRITFLDTPGHEAFSAMRARGASVTDIVIIVVAADDGVKPQTREAIAHAKAAGVPIIIAITKIDKPEAKPDLVKTQLGEFELVPVEWGGQSEFIHVSAKSGEGVESLLETVLVQAELLELRANESRLAKASIIESSLQKGRGPVATVIVQNGSLRVGDTVVAGVAYGKVRAMSDDTGAPLDLIRPGECGVIIGLSEVAAAGEVLIGVNSDKEAREYAAKRYEYNRQKELSKSTKVSLDELGARIQEGNVKTLPVILKADVQGSLEAIRASLEKLRNEEIKINLIHSGVGGITQSDVELAAASENCLVLGFNVRPTGELKERAKERRVEIKTYNVIYKLIDEVRAILGGLMSPVISEIQLGQAQIRQVINVPKIGQIAGCLVTEGVINRGAKIRLIREGVVVFEGNVSSLKRFKDDAKEVAKGYECGVGIEGCADLREGDFIESYEERQESAQL